MGIRRFQFISVLMIFFSLSGCSLLEVKIDTQTTPLTKQELTMRLLTREYAQQFFSQVEQAGDATSSLYDPQDRLNQSYVLLWKINAEEGIQSSAYQVSPMAALIDSWVFTNQMANFFESGAGAELFESAHARQASTQLRTEVDDLAKSVLKDDSYASTKQFVTQYAEQYPFNDLSFIRQPAYRAWLKSQGITDEEAVANLGTMPEALGDVSDRLSIVSEQTPKLMTWKAQLIAMNSNVSGQQLTTTLESIEGTSRAFRDFVENNPEYMENLAKQMSIQLQPLVSEIDDRTEKRLEQLSKERQALEKMVARERAEIALIISAEREKFTNNLDALSQDLIALAIDKVVMLIKNTIIYFILFILVIFFAPLGLGYMLGKRAKSAS